jgi:hypothetical protein
MLVVYNDDGKSQSLGELFASPKTDCFHVDGPIPMGKSEFDKLIKVMADCVYSRIIPEMPDPKDWEAFLRWEQRYYDLPVERLDG